MHSISGPFSAERQKTEALVKEWLGTMPEGLYLDLFSTEHAFSYKSNHELKKAAWLFSLMNRPGLVGLASTFGLQAIKLRLPFVETIIRNTIFGQFCGGTDLNTSQDTVKKLAAAGVFSILDYGAEGKETAADFDQTMEETVRALIFAAGNAAIPMVSTKITGMARFGLLEALHRGDQLSADEMHEYESALERIRQICSAAAESGTAISFDAEESWIQRPIDDFARTMMKAFNRDKAVVYNTYQLYLADRLDALKNAHEEAQKEGYVLGAKLVRGAYLEKEHRRAETMGYPCPIQPDKASTDRDYDRALVYCIEHIEEIACCNASHNAGSAMLLAALTIQHQIPKDHPHVFFAQLYGMSDNLTFNLAKAGFNAGKYVIYGAVRDVMPYLIRRAQENTAVSGDMGREYRLIASEMKRRGL